MRGAARAPAGGPDIFWPDAVPQPDRFADVCRQAHSALQWLARLCQSYRTPEPGNRHLLLDWTDQRLAIVTPEFLPGITTELRFHKFFLHFREHGVPTPHPMVLDDCSPAEVEAWCLIELLHRNLDRDRFSKDLPYDVPTLMKGDAEYFDSRDREAEFTGFGTLLADAAAVLRLAEPAAGPVRIAPEDFTLCLDGERGAGSIGFCLGSPGADGPFFYRTDGAATAGEGSTAATPPPPRARDPRTRRLTLDEIRAQGLTAGDIADFLAGPAARG